MKAFLLAIVLCLCAHAFALEKCVIKADNPDQPLKTYPWNFFTCGKNVYGHWVWLVGISRLSDSNYMLQVAYLPTLTTEAYFVMEPGGWATIPGPLGQSLKVKVTKREGNFENWQKLKVWIDVIGEYVP